MSRQAYEYKMRKTFFHSPTWYQVCKHMSIAEACAHSVNLRQQFLPRKAWPRTVVTQDQLPFAYITHKTKCINVNGTLKNHDCGLICERAHAHEQEIISDCRHPSKQFLKKTARALRLVKKLS